MFCYTVAANPTSQIRSATVRLDTKDRIGVPTSGSPFIFVTKQWSANPTLVSSPPAGPVGNAYFSQLQGQGGDGNVQVSVSPQADSLGLHVSSTGLITGTPTTPGQAQFSVGLTDSADSDLAGNPDAR